MAFYKSYLKSFTTPEEVTPTIGGNKSCSCRCVVDSDHDNNQWIYASGSANCYVDIENAVGNVTITISGSGASDRSEGNYGYSWACSASFNGITGSRSGSGSFTINVGDVPVSGRVAITPSCDSKVRAYSSGYYSQASCTVTSVKYNQSKSITEKLAYFKNNT